MKDRICVGAITGSFGVKGEARVKSFCADPAAIGDYGPLSSEDGSRSFTLKITRPVKTGFAVRLSGVTSKEQADALRGTRLYAPRDALPGLPDDEFYHADLIGLTVLDTGGTDHGKVHAVHNHGAGDLLELRPKGRKGGVLVPFTRDIVPTVDLTSGRIIIDPPEGLFDDPDSST
ncbi:MULTISPECIES: ribosome maturation factor RimM [Paracoccaceae]|jgi:16S rRNA processing protein RimM|uniref:ribosome maturation factor RimM n=1 Tax=Rhodobacterales TaxID=204455 RepID=UPI001B0C23C0|nr:ribosome maturation factor RimM [Boseongicola sp. H5]MBO6604317.1 ribosome maturation factor RimM [Roseicyclus sp.]MBO6624629.1 ribosome maturation factor RimM [Roseicyclus sp.]MBO6921621.1 ribosome maturation factor RimM [Roseicyclus sp.]